MKEKYVKPLICANDSVSGLFPAIGAFVAGVSAGRALGHALKGVILPADKLEGLNTGTAGLAMDM